MTIIINYYISADGKIRRSFEPDKDRIEIGNYFETEKEAKEMLEILKQKANRNESQPKS